MNRRVIFSFVQQCKMYFETRDLANVLKENEHDLVIKSSAKRTFFLTSLFKVPLQMPRRICFQKMKKTASKFSKKS